MILIDEYGTELVVSFVRGSGVTLSARRGPFQFECRLGWNQWLRLADWIARGNAPLAPPQHPLVAAMVQETCERAGCAYNDAGGRLTRGNCCDPACPYTELERSNWRAIAQYAVAPFQPSTGDDNGNEA